MTDPRPTPFQVLVVGGCYAGISATLNLLDLCSGRHARCDRTEPAPVFPHPLVDVRITIVDERDGFYHLIGSPLALASEDYSEKAWIKFENVPALQDPRVRIVHGSVSSLDPEHKSATVVHHGGAETSQISYDYAVVAAGLRRVWPVVPQSLKRKHYLFEAGDHIRGVANAQHGVVVVGGGAVGIEMAAELKLISPHGPVTLVHSRSKLLSAEPLPDDCKDKALELLREADVDILLEHRVDKTVERTENGTKVYEVHFTNGHSMLANQVVMAISKSVPSTSFLPAKALNAEGYVRIQPTLQFPTDTPNSADHYAVGDLVAWSGIKRCGGAMHMGQHAANNIHQLMLQQQSSSCGGGDAHVPEFLSIAEVPPMIGLAVGKKAVAYDPVGGVVSGEETMKMFFGDDLGLKICWNWLRLGGYDKVTV